MIKWRVILFFVVALAVFAALAPENAKGQKLRDRLRANFQYFIQSLTIALILYWLLVILAPWR